MENKNTVDTVEPLEEKVEDEKVEATKKPRTQKQIDALIKMRLTREENVKSRALEKQKVMEEDKKVIEEKILKKAVSIKKKQIKRDIVLDDITDDDEPIEEIKKKIVKSKKVFAPIEPVPITEPERPKRPMIYFV